MVMVMMLMSDILIEVDDGYWQWKGRIISSFKRQLPPKEGVALFCIFTIVRNDDMHRDLYFTKGNDDMHRDLLKKIATESFHE